jgi:hypothetical protein
VSLHAASRRSSLLPLTCCERDVRIIHLDEDIARDLVGYGGVHRAGFQVHSDATPAKRLGSPSPDADQHFDIVALMCFHSEMSSWFERCNTRAPAMVLVLTMCAACSGDDDASSAPGSNVTPECVTRAERYELTTTFSYKANQDDHVLRNCAPTCGDTTLGRDDAPSVASLPAGECGSADARCDSLAFAQCRCTAPGTGPINVYRCACLSGRWHCDVISQGASACPAETCDASAR